MKRLGKIGRGVIVIMAMAGLMAVAGLRSCGSCKPGAPQTTLAHSFKLSGC